MTHRLRILRGIPIPSLLICLVALAVVAPADANEVVQWNETTMAAIETNGQSTIVSTRTWQW